LTAQRRADSWAVRGELLLVATVVLLAANPLTWGCAPPWLWYPPAGVGLVLVAWLRLGLGGALVFFAGLLVLSVRAALALSLGPDPLPARELAFAGVDAVLTALEAGLAWWLYHRRAGGGRQLIDPRSATQFLVLVPGVVAGLFAVVRCLVVDALFWGASAATNPPFLANAATTWFGQKLAVFWLERALGELILAPPPLLLVTPWLLRRGLIPPSSRAGRPGAGMTSTRTQ
jgi:hypothetical protein